MSQTPPDANTHERKRPNIEFVIVLAAAVLFVLLAAAYILLHHGIHKLMPQPQTHSPALILNK